MQWSNEIANADVLEVFLLMLTVFSMVCLANECMSLPVVSFECLDFLLDFPLAEIIALTFPLQGFPASIFPPYYALVWNPAMASSLAVGGGTLVQDQGYLDHLFFIRPILSKFLILQETF